VESLVVDSHGETWMTAGIRDQLKMPTSA